jgi:hypothetical protein
MASEAQTVAHLANPTVADNPVVAASPFSADAKGFVTFDPEADQQLGIQEQAAVANSLAGAAVETRTGTRNPEVPQGGLPTFLKVLDNVRQTVLLGSSAVKNVAGALNEQAKFGRAMLGERNNRAADLLGRMREAIDAGDENAYQDALSRMVEMDPTFDVNQLPFIPNAPIISNEPQVAANKAAAEKLLGTAINARNAGDERTFNAALDQLERVAQGYSHGLEFVRPVAVDPFKRIETMRAGILERLLTNLEDAPTEEDFNQIKERLLRDYPDQFTVDEFINMNYVQRPSTLNQLKQLLRLK